MPRYRHTRDVAQNLLLDAGVLQRVEPGEVIEVDQEINNVWFEKTTAKVGIPAESGKKA